MAVAQPVQYPDCDLALAVKLLVQVDRSRVLLAPSILSILGGLSSTNGTRPAAYQLSFFV